MASTSHNNAIDASSGTGTGAGTGGVPSRVTPPPFAPSFLDRVQNGVRGFIRGVTGNTWFTPGQPIYEVAPAEPVRRQSYPVGYNYVYTPRAYENISFWQLRALSNNYDLIRILIETRKDQIARLPNNFRVTPLPGEPPDHHARRNREDKRIPLLQEFFKRPDREHTFHTWQRAIIDQQLTIDAVSILPRWKYDGHLYGFDVIDGATIAPTIDREGRRPIPPDPAYQQVIHGVPMRDLSAMDPTTVSDQLMYCPRNYRAERVYGYSPVEQIIMTINIALRRQLHQLEFYTEGTIPDAVIEMPDGWTSDEIIEFEKYWNSVMTGQTGERRKAKFVPAGSKVNFTKDWKLKDEMDDYIIRVAAYAFGVSPIALVKMVNRAAGQQISDDSRMEGLEPIQIWFTNDVMNPIIQEYIGFKDIEHIFGEVNRSKPLEQAQIDAIYLDRNVVLPSEIRVRSGMDPLTQEQVDEEVRPSPESQANDLMVASGAAGTKDKVGTRAGAGGGAAPSSGAAPPRKSPRMTPADQGLSRKPGGADAGKFAGSNGHSKSDIGGI